MAILSNINDLFRVDSAGAVYFATSAGANLQVLQSVGTGGSPIWVDVDDIIGGPYLPLTGGTLTGNLALTDATNNPSLVISTGTLTVGGVTTLNAALTGTNATFEGVVFANGEGNGFLIDAATAATARTGFMKYGGTEGQIISGNSTKIRLTHRTDSDYVYGGTPTIREDLVISALGNVGIAETDPDDLLHITSPSWAFRIQSSVNDNYLRMSENQIAAFDSSGGGSAFYINNSSTGNIFMAGGGGNIGVGTLSPNNLLNLSRNVANGDVATYIQNFNADTGSTNETASVKFAHGNDAVIGYVGAKVVCGKEGDFETSIPNIKGFLSFYTASGTSLDSDVNNIERMRIGGDGNVSIGAGTGGARNARLLLDNVGSQGTPQLMLIDSDDSGKQSEIRFDSGNLIFDYWGGTSRAEYFRIKSDGDVGIGVTDPLFKLDIFDSVSPVVLQIKSTSSSGAGFYIDNDRTGSKKFGLLVGNVAAGAFSIKDEDAGLNRLVIDSSGYVNISQKQNSGLGYDLLINIGTSPDGKIGYQTQDQLAANLAVNANSNWVKTGNNIYNSNSANVGIGTSTIPSDHILQISNDSQSYARVALTNSQTGNASGDGLIFQMETLNSIIKNQENGSLAFGTNGRETDLYINSGGDVGINYTGPYNQISGGETTLAIADADNASLYLKSNATGGHNHILFSGTGGSLSFYDKTRGDYSMIINASGNVGINTVSPTNGKLEIQQTATTAALWVQTGGTTNSYSIADFRTGTNLSALRINGDGNSLFGGNIGINSTSPNVKLQVNATGGNISSGNAINLSTMKGIKLTNTLNDDSSVGLWFGTNNVHWSGISGQRNNSASTWGTDLRFYTHESATTDLTYSRERMRITSEGFVGILTDAPAYTLDVTGNVRVTDRLGVGTTPDTAAAGDRLKIQGGNNGLGCIKAISGQYSYGVRIEGSNLSTQLACYSSSTALTTQINFETAGNSSAGKITTTGNSTAYNTLSDYRVKENVIPISDSISRLNQLKPSRFNFIGESNKTVDGFIAHEVQDIVPEAIVGEKDEIDKDGNPVHQGIDQAKLVPLLVAAIQELEARVKELENK